MIRRISLVLLLGLMLVSGLVHAQTPVPTTRSSQNSGYPARTDLYVNDLGNVLSSSEESSLRDLVRRIGADFDLTVLTIGGVVDYDSTEPTIETFSTNLFNRWGIGSEAKNTGMLVVLAIRNRDIRIELGDGYGREYDDDMKAVIEEYMIPRFKEGNYAKGLTDGVAQIYREIEGRLPRGVVEPSRPVATARPSTSNSYNYSRSEASDEGDLGPMALGLAGLAGVAGVGTAGAWGFRELLRRRPRKCASCNTMMVRLDEAADDAYLDEGQRMEEMLGSINYDIWECPSCQARDMYDYSAWFSGYSACTQCGYRTTSRTSTVLDHATEYSTGLRRVQTQCQHCNYHQEWNETIPRVTRSRSSGGGSHRSGGGGSSSGGGASGSW
jgi:uncharacterized protein